MSETEHEYTAAFYPSSKVYTALAHGWHCTCGAESARRFPNPDAALRNWILHGRGVAEGKENPR
jgi:hypothetical protein